MFLKLSFICSCFVISFCVSFLYGEMVHSTTTTATDTECKDKLTNCFYYNDQQCLGLYAPWAKENCAYRCGYCRGKYPPCEDAITFCKELGTDACTNPSYRGYMREKCRKTCNTCTLPALNYVATNNTAIIKPTDNVPTTSGAEVKPVNSACVDKQNNCFNYDDLKCLGIYEPWARAHCPYRCGYCPDKPPCEDKIALCNEYGSDACTNPRYSAWARTNCRKYCNRCDVPYKGNNTITQAPVTSLAYMKTTITPTQINTQKPSQSPATNANITPQKGSTMVPSKQLSTMTTNQVTQRGCHDVRSDCADYGEESCFGVFAQWAVKNCARRCGYCDNHFPLCSDYDYDCARLPQTLCTAIEYRSIAATACRKFCGFCQDTTVMTGASTSTSIPSTVHPTLKPLPTDQPTKAAMRQTTLKPILATSSLLPTKRTLTTSTDAASTMLKTSPKPNPSTAPTETKSSTKTVSTILKTSSKPNFSTALITMMKTSIIPTVRLPQASTQKPATLNPMSSTTSNNQTPKPPTMSQSIKLSSKMPTLPPSSPIKSTKPSTAINTPASTKIIRPPVTQQIQTSKSGPTVPQVVPTIGATRPPVCNTSYVDPIPKCCKVCACPGERITGRVINSRNKPIPKAEVYFSGCECYRYLTNDSGNYSIKNICVKGRELLFSRDGYMDSKMLPVKVSTGETTWNADNILVDSPVFYNITSVLKRK